MTDPDAVLGRIDDLLDGVDDDWSISGDAMRWAPPGKREQAASTPTHYTYAVMDEEYEFTSDVRVPMRNGSQTADAWEAARRQVMGSGQWQGFRRFILNQPVEVTLVRCDHEPSSDSVPAILSPAESVIPGPDGPIHIRHAYGDQPAEITQLDLDDTEDEHT